MPDDWSRYGIDEKGKEYELSDSARYRIQGNGVALPFWSWLLKRISAQYERPATLGSLFSGQGSFEYAWVKIGNKAVWSSEVEKMRLQCVGCTLVTKKKGLTEISKNICKWKRTHVFSNEYLVSDDGRLFSLRSNSGGRWF